MTKALATRPVDLIESAILFIRGERVILDSDLARLYGVTTARLNQQVKRNLERFANDFMFQLTRKEFDALILQFATSKQRGGRRKLPLVFTEHGAIMAANVLNSKRAVQASVQVVRAFIKLRQMLTSNAELARKLSDLERRYDSQFKVVFDAIRQLMSPPVPQRKQIGFTKGRRDERRPVRRLAVVPEEMPLPGSYRPKLASSSIFSAKGAECDSLGQRPRTGVIEIASALKARNNPQSHTYRSSYSI